MLVSKIDGYAFNRDYERLADLMKIQSVICIVDYGKASRDVARTIYKILPDSEEWQISARGICYIDAFSREEFVALCTQRNVCVLMPTKLPLGETDERASY